MQNPTLWHKYSLEIYQVYHTIHLHLTLRITILVSQQLTLCFLFNESFTQVNILKHMNLCVLYSVQVCVDIAMLSLHIFHSPQWIKRIAEPGKNFTPI